MTGHSSFSHRFAKNSSFLHSSLYYLPQKVGQVHVYRQKYAVNAFLKEVHISQFHVFSQVQGLFFLEFFFFITTLCHFIKVFLVLFQKISTISTRIDHCILFFILEISTNITFFYQKYTFLSLQRPALLQKSQVGTKNFVFSDSNQKVLSVRIKNNIESYLKKQLLLCKNCIFWIFDKFHKDYNFLILNNIVVSIPNMHLLNLKIIVRVRGM